MQRTSRSRRSTIGIKGRRNGSAVGLTAIRPFHWTLAVRISGRGVTMVKHNEGWPQDEHASSEKDATDSACTSAMLLTAKRLWVGHS